ncbi:hypothetical protein [Acerihabitans arboris]|uniref:Uncharacterized protein n=1 Tax=Acerihabitans arboris TaxID=2691583 RepID=A0A845SNF7_9GAMM|nr:hypothetical protein [Acerihabitans arboris]NDL64131.1 hypothetical protein [Acerihabitans arboris]
MSEQVPWPVRERGLFNHITKTKLKRVAHPNNAFPYWLPRLSAFRPKEPPDRAIFTDQRHLDCGLRPFFRCKDSGIIVVEIGLYMPRFNHIHIHLNARLLQLFGK